jgi:1,5-anhydro-D-fructose reductase (1,5-anhydro-D-mannitol-forming)
MGRDNKPSTTTSSPAMIDIILHTKEQNTHVYIKKSASKLVRWGIVGLGDVTTTKSGPPFWKCSNSVLVATMKRTPNAAQRWVESNVPVQQIPSGNDNVANTTIQCIGYDNLLEFLQHPQLDAVYVSTHPDSHCDVAIQCIKAGKHVYVEKPVGRCLQETVAIQNAAKEFGVSLYTAYISRAYERTNKIRSLIFDEKAVGSKVTSIEYKLVGSGGARDINLKSNNIPWRYNRIESGGGLLMDVGCHVIDRIDFICNGPIVNIHNVIAEKRNTDLPKVTVEDYVHFDASIGPSLSSSSATVTEGAHLSCTWDFTGHSKDELDQMLIKGNNNRSIRFTAMSPSLPVYLYDDATDTVLQEYKFDPIEHTAQPMIEAITAELLLQRDQMKTPKPTATTIEQLKQKQFPAYISRGDNAIRTSAVLDDVLISYYKTRDIGFWDTTNSILQKGR